MVQFNGPHGKVTVSYLRRGGLNPPAPAPRDAFAGKTVLITGCSSGIVRPLQSSLPHYSTMRD